MFGPKLSKPQTIPLPQAEFGNGKITGTVIYVDRFGNLITNISSRLIQDQFKDAHPLVIRIGKRKIRGIAANYAALEKGQLGVVVGSWDTLEICCREGNAA